MYFVGLFSPYDHGIHQPVKEPSALHQGREEVHDPSRCSGGLANRGGRQERHADRQADGEVIPDGNGEKDILAQTERRFFQGS